MHRSTGDQEVAGSTLPEVGNILSWRLIMKYFITKTCLYNFDPIKPHFYIVKLGFTGVYIIFLISAQRHRLWVLVRTASSSFSPENFHFWVVKFSIYLNGRVFVMFYGHSFPSADSRRAVVSFWRNVHNTG